MLQILRYTFVCLQWYIVAIDCTFLFFHHLVFDCKGYLKQKHFRNIGRFYCRGSWTNTSHCNSNGTFSFYVFIVWFDVSFLSLNVVYKLYVLMLWRIYHTHPRAFGWSGLRFWVRFESSSENAISLKFKKKLSRVLLSVAFLLWPTQWINLCGCV
jgi:hypothetical protein